MSLLPFDQIVTRVLVYSSKMHLKLKTDLQGILVDFNSGPKVRFPWGSGYWPVPFSSDEALQIAGLFHQGQFPFFSRYEARRVQHFPDFNLESIFITKNVFIMKNPTDFG